VRSYLEKKEKEKKRDDKKGLVEWLKWYLPT
jgi:hypothetical protein